MAAGADTTPPTIAITSNQASLSSGQTALITFTISEATSDFTSTDIDVTGGTLGTLTHVGVNSSGQDIYTATFTPTASSTTAATIGVTAGKFHDAANNQNLDTYSLSADSVANHVLETNNQVTISVNTTVTSSLTLINDTATAVESGVTSGNTAVAGTNPSGNVLTNDTAATSVTGIVAGSTTGTVGSVRCV